MSRHATATESLHWNVTYTSTARMKIPSRTEPQLGKAAHYYRRRLTHATAGTRGTSDVAVQSNERKQLDIAGSANWKREQKQHHTFQKAEFRDVAKRPGPFRVDRYLRVKM